MTIGPYTDDHGTRWEPFGNDQGRLGFKVTYPSGDEHEVYFQVSSRDSEGESNVFIYIDDYPTTHIVPEAWPK